MLMTYVNIFSNDSKIFANVRIDASPSKPPSFSKHVTKKNKFDAYCDICCTNKLNIEQNMAAAIDECSHYFCRECWRMHFESLINDSFWNRFAATSKAFECMQTKCCAIASKDFVLNCLKYNINNNEESYCAGVSTAGGSSDTTTTTTETTPLWRLVLKEMVFRVGFGS